MYGWNCCVDVDLEIFKVSGLELIGNKKTP